MAKADSEVVQDYIRYTSEFCAKIGNEAGWPAHILTNPAKRPRIHSSHQSFVDDMLFGEHVDTIVMLPPGVASNSPFDFEAECNALKKDSKLNSQSSDNAGGSHTSIHKPGEGDVGGAAHDMHGLRKIRPTSVNPEIVLESGMVQAIKGARSAREVLANLAKSSHIETLKGNMFVKTNGHGKRDESIRAEDGSKYLGRKWQTVCKRSDFNKIADTISCAEIRKQKEYRKNGRAYKTTLQKTMRDRVKTENFMYWDDYSEGLFVSPNCAGYNLHVDQIVTSNIGSQFLGHKLLAVWAYPDATNDVLEDCFRAVFTPPLSTEQVKVLEGACTVALIPPGSVWFFCGANAHTACNLGYGPLFPSLTNNEISQTPLEPTVCVNSYEAFVGLNAKHVKMMTQTNVEPYHWDGCWLDEDSLDDFKGDVYDRIEELDDLLKQDKIGLSVVPVMQKAIKLCRDWARVPISRSASPAPVRETFVDDDIDRDTVQSVKKIRYSKELAADRATRAERVGAQDGSNLGITDSMATSSLENANL